MVLYHQKQACIPHRQTIDQTSQIANPNGLDMRHQSTNGNAVTGVGQIGRSGSYTEMATGNEAVAEAGTPIPNKLAVVVQLMHAGS